MITLFASLVGFLSSLTPEILKLFKYIYDKKYQLELNNHKSNSGTQQFSISETSLKDKENSEQKLLHKNFFSGIKWIDALNASVRPLLAYSFFLLYVSVKFAQYKVLVEKGQLAECLHIIWNMDDQAIFAGIISFYYGQRTFSKLWNQKIFK